MTFVFFTQIRWRVIFATSRILSNASYAPFSFSLSHIRDLFDFLSFYELFFRRCDTVRTPLCVQLDTQLVHTTHNSYLRYILHDIYVYIYNICVYMLHIMYMTCNTCDIYVHMYTWYRMLVPRLDSPPPPTPPHSSPLHSLNAIKFLNTIAKRDVNFTMITNRTAKWTIRVSHVILFHSSPSFLSFCR